MNSWNDYIVVRLRKRAEIRRNIHSRKSVQEGKPDRLSDLLEEAADEIEKIWKLNHSLQHRIWELESTVDNFSGSQFKEIT